MSGGNLDEEEQPEIVLFSLHQFHNQKFRYSKLGQPFQIATAIVFLYLLLVICVTPFLLNWLYTFDEYILSL